MDKVDARFAGLAIAATVATLFATVIATGAPAYAATPIVVETVPAQTATVGHADLNLASAAGVKRLNTRVRQTAERLCIERGTRSVQEIVAGRACVTVAVDAARPQVRQAIAYQLNGQLAAATK